MKNKNILTLLICILFVWLFAITYFVVTMANKDSESEIKNYTVSGYSTDLSKVVDKNKSSIVSIDAEGDISTGFICAKEDNSVYVVSSLHGVNGKENVDVYLNNGEKIKGNVKVVDPFLDIALIECECFYEIKPIVFGDSKLLNDGEFVIAIGTNGSLEYDFSSAFGMVSSKYRELENKINYNGSSYSYNLGVVQLTGDFSSGYSGSPIFNMNGDLVGVITMQDDNVTLAISANEAKIVIDKMIGGEEYHRFDFGISGKFITELENYEATNLNISIDTSYGYYINSIRPNSFANNVGLNKGDVILKINDIDITNLDSLLASMYGDIREFSITVIRNNEKMNFIGIVND